jgi:6-pyruvoyl-tetrahydropterin synthase
MNSAVARLYKFEATHHVEGLADPWRSPHGHGYTVEVVAEGEGPLVVDTDVLDAAWAPLAERLEGADLNEAVGGPTTVEDLAMRLLKEFPWPARQVTVWEDDDRWGRARR